MEIGAEKSSTSWRGPHRTTPRQAHEYRATPQLRKCSGNRTISNMSGPIEALYIYDEHKYVIQPQNTTKLTSPSRPILTHIYTSRPLTATQLLPLFLAHPQPRSNLIYLPNTSPATLVFSLEHANLLFLLTSSSEIEPLLALEFLHRVIDVLEEFVGSPLLSSKIESSYEVVAQLLNEMCDGGAVSTTEPNALRDLVEVEGWVGKLLGGISIPGYVLVAQ